MIRYPLDLRDASGNPLRPEDAKAGQIVTTGLKAIDTHTRQTMNRLKRFRICGSVRYERALRRALRISCLETARVKRAQHQAERRQLRIQRRKAKAASEPSANSTDPQTRQQ